MFRGNTEVSSLCQIQWEFCWTKVGQIRPPRSNCCFERNRASFLADVDVNEHISICIISITLLTLSPGFHDCPHSWLWRLEGSSPRPETFGDFCNGDKQRQRQSGCSQRDTVIDMADLLQRLSWTSRWSGVSAIASDVPFVFGFFTMYQLLKLQRMARQRIPQRNFSTSSIFNVTSSP